jgi:thiamine transport system substrate-binding protein
MKKEYVIALSLVLIVVVASLAYYFITYAPQPEKKTLTVYTYSSLLAWGKNRNATYDKVFGGFERKYGVKIQLVKFSDTGTMLAKLIEEHKSGNVRADVVIGLDNLQLVKAKKAGVLKPYIPSDISEIPSWLIMAYDPEHYATPYDFGLIAFVYDTKYLKPSELKGLTFQSFENSSLGKTLVVEDPRTSSVGLSFLIYEITVYQKYYHKDWRAWWSQVKPAVKSNWDEAFDAFDKGKYHMMVSYATDPAYSVYFYNSTRYGAILPTYNGKMLGWLQIEGIGLVNGSKHPELAEKFIDWFLSENVQSEIPLNNWMYPANKNVHLPSCFKYAINISDVEVVNLKTSSEEIEKSLQDWLNEWVNIMGSS